MKNMVNIFQSISNSVKSVFSGSSSSSSSASTNQSKQTTSTSSSSSSSSTSNALNRNTYNPSTGTYVSSSGQGYSVAPSNVSSLAKKTSGTSNVGLSVSPISSSTASSSSTKSSSGGGAVSSGHSRSSSSSSYSQSTGTLSVGGQSYSVAPENVSSVVAQKTGSTIQASSQSQNINMSLYNPTAQTAPRSYNPQETQAVASQVNIPNIPYEQKTYAGTISATKPGEYSKPSYVESLPFTERVEFKTNEFVNKGLNQGNQLSYAGAAAASFGLGVFKFGKDTITDVSPVDYDMKLRIPFSDTAKGIYGTITDIPGSVKGFTQNLMEKPYETVGYSTAPILIEGAIKGGVGRVKSEYVSFGSEKVAPESVYSKQVLSGAKRLPEATSTEQSLRLFNRPNELGEIKVTTAAPSKLSEMEAGIGGKASLGLEDPGIYVTARGEGSPYFHRIEGTSGYSISLNPKDIFPTDILKQPTVTEFTVRDVQLQPRSVVNKPGFGGVQEFFEKTGSQTGSAYITKRSELGLGSVQRQQFSLSKDIVDPFTGKEVKAGQLMYEHGTIEQEGVIPYKAKFEYVIPEKGISKFKGYSKYTTYEGVNIPIREAKLIGGSTSESAFELSGKTFAVADVAEEQSLLSSSIYGAKRSTPYPSILSISGASKTKTPGYSSTSPTISKITIYPKSSYLPETSKSTVFGGGSSGVSGGSSGNSVLSEIYGGSSGISGGSGGSGIGSGISGKSGFYGISGTYGGISKGPQSIPFNPQIQQPPYFASTQKKKSSKKQVIFQMSKPGKMKNFEVFILPDLRSVSITEAKQGGRRAYAPKATSPVIEASYKAFKGLSVGIVPTEQMRRRSI